MAQNLVKTAISNFFSIRTDIFEEGSKYEDFIEIETSPSTADGFNSTLTFGQIAYRDVRGNARKSTPIMFKLMPKVKNTRYISNAFINEMTFFTKIIPTLSQLNDSFSSLFPKFYHGEMIFNIDDQSLIMFEDLKSRGFRMTEKISFLDREHLILMMRKLGQFHAYSYKAKRDIPDLFYPLASHCLEANTFVNLEHQGIFSIIGQPGLEHLLRNHPSYEKYASNIANMLQHAHKIYIRAVCGDKRDPTTVFCHGDFLRNNAMFRYENNIPVDMVFVDLATYRIASPVVDLITVLYFNTDQQTRNELWDTLIDEYYTALKTTFPENRVPIKSEIMSQFFGRAFCAYIVATTFLPYLITKDSGATLTDYEQLMSPEYENRGLYQTPPDVLGQLVLAAGSEAGNQALSDILKDMIDRGFICR